MRNKDKMTISFSAEATPFAEWFLPGEFRVNGHDCMSLRNAIDVILDTYVRSGEERWFEDIDVRTGKYGSAMICVQIIGDQINVYRS